MTGSLSAFRHGGCVLWLLLAACATTHHRPPPPAAGDASWRVAVPPGMVRYALALGEVSSGASPFKRVAPVYPPELLARCLPPQEVPALLIVDGQGKVGEVRVTDEVQADAGRRAFIDAVRAAALQWQFNPLLITRWAADADGNSHAVDSGTKPFSLAYVFRFECHAGRAAVSSAAAQP
ncbi:hypothetical protein DEO45_12895 [Rhodanobacter denitrificans]|uniref:Energy transducer TonB n=1 Tax=Rhodanobacter denitrificans TaxID=666685 RepID=A0A368KC33_9GAMM|nr:hypothetical protein [Rhodanobacter denitrificans]RCS29387.1 hypothetical protein DEO45_12895 [Rhodanobacter denitrificans]